jgi:hypothetical protein
MLTWLLLAVAVAAVGCGPHQSPLATAPLSDEEKAKIKAHDQQVDQEERNGAGTATPRKKRP